MWKVLLSDVFLLVPEAEAWARQGNASREKLNDRFAQISTRKEKLKAFFVPNKTQLITVEKTNSDSKLISINSKTREVKVKYWASRSTKMTFKSHIECLARRASHPWEESAGWWTLKGKMTSTSVGEENITSLNILDQIQERAKKTIKARTSYYQLKLDSHHRDLAGWRRAPHPSPTRPTPATDEAARKRRRAGGTSLLHGARPANVALQILQVLDSLNL